MSQGQDRLEFGLWIHFSTHKFITQPTVGNSKIQVNVSFKFRFD